MQTDVRSWGRMGHSLQTGDVTFESLYGTGYYQWFTDPDRARDAERFELSSESVNPLVLRTVLRCYDWGAHRTLVDVGGGYGSFALGVLDRCPDLSVTVLDQPHVAAVGSRRAAEHPAADRCTFQGGSFFDEVPAGADAYLLKTVLHDWPDAEALDNSTCVRQEVVALQRVQVGVDRCLDGRRPRHVAQQRDLAEVVALSCAVVWRPPASMSSSPSRTM